LPIEPQTAATQASLKPTITLSDLIWLIVGSVIGSGIFLVPGPILRDVGGSVRLSVMVWVAGGVLSLLGALTYGELTAMNPAAGGLYVYVRDAFGELPGFLYGWTLFWVIATGTNATLAVAFSNYLNQIVPLTKLEGQLAAVAMIGVATVVNVLGTRRSTDLNNWATWTKLIAIAAMSAALLILGRGWGHGGARAAEVLTTPAGGSMFAGFGVAMIAVLWAYEGWQWVTYTASETINPQRNFPRGFLIGTLLLIVVYVVADVAYLVALGPADAARSDTIAATAVAAVLGSDTAKFVALTILISVFSSANSGVLMAPRVFYAMARDRLFFRRLADVSPRFHTPAFAIVTAGIWSAILAWSSTFQQLFTYVVFAGWVFYGLAAASIFVFRRRAHGAKRPYSVPGYPWTPLAFVLASGAVVINTIVADWRDAAFGLGIMALGLPAYFFWRSRRSAPAA